MKQTNTSKQKESNSMTKIDLVRQEMIKTLKAKEMERKNALSMLLSALKAKFIDKRADLTEDEENAIVYKEIKEAQETMESAPKDRVDIIRECEFKIKVYSEFAPQMMAEGEIKQTIQSVIDQLGISAPTAKDKGKIMKSLMPLVKGKADGGLVNKLVGELLQ
jgi:uncharacterized protein YqeY